MYAGRPLVLGFAVCDKATLNVTGFLGHGFSCWLMSLAGVSDTARLADPETAVKRTNVRPDFRYFACVR